MSALLLSVHAITIGGLTNTCWDQNQPRMLLCGATGGGGGNQFNELHICPYICFSTVAATGTATAYILIFDMVHFFIHIYINIYV